MLCWIIVKLWKTVSSCCLPQKCSTIACVNTFPPYLAGYALSLHHSCHLWMFIQSVQWFQVLLLLMVRLEPSTFIVCFVEDFPPTLQVMLVCFSLFCGRLWTSPGNKNTMAIHLVYSFISGDMIYLMVGSPVHSWISYNALKAS